VLTDVQFSEETMAFFEVGPITQFLDDAEIKALMKSLKKVGLEKLPESDDAGGAVGDEIDDDVWNDFLDRLEAEDVGADLYLPLEFDGVLDVAGYRVASANTLKDVLDDIKDDLDVDHERDSDDDEDDEDAGSDDDDDDDSDEELRFKERLMKQVWKTLYTGAKHALAKDLPLFVKTG
jgi:hypothetical protein